MVKIRMKKLGRKHRPFFRICAVDSRSPRDGKIIEELGAYDPMIRETDKRATLNRDRIEYWLSVGAQPSGNVAVLLKKQGINPKPGHRPVAQPGNNDEIRMTKETPSPNS